MPPPGSFVGSDSALARASGVPARGREPIAQLFGNSPPSIGHTAALAVLWVTWKSRNKMVFDALRLSPRNIARQIGEHVKLWVCRAPSRLDTEPLRS